MAILPISGATVRITLPSEPVGHEVAAFLVAASLARSRVERSPIRHPQAWAESVVAGLHKPTRLGSRSMTNLARAREMLPVYLAHSNGVRPDWASTNALVDLVLRQETPTRRPVACPKEGAPALLRGAFEAVIGHALVHGDTCVVCWASARRGAGVGLLGKLDVDPRIVWDLVASAQAARWLPPLAKEQMATVEEEELPF